MAENKPNIDSLGFDRSLSPYEAFKAKIDKNYSDTPRVPGSDIAFNGRTRDEMLIMIEHIKMFKNWDEYDAHIKDAEQYE